MNLLTSQIERAARKILIFGQSHASFVFILSQVCRYESGIDLIISFLARN